MSKRPERINYVKEKYGYVVDEKYNNKTRSEFLVDKGYIELAKILTDNKDR